MRISYNKILNLVRGPVAALLLLACGGLPSAASTETATRLYDSSKLELTRTAEADGSEYLHVSLPGLDQTATPGEPQLPVEYIRFLVPVYTKVTGVSAEARQTFPRTSGVRVYPAQEPVTTNHEGPVEFTAPSAAAYSRDYGIRAEYVDDGFIDGCNHIVTVAVYPVGYSPAGGTLTAASEVTVTLEYESCTAAEMTSAPLFPPVRSRYLDLDAMVVNPSKTTDRRYAPRVPALDDAREYYYIITPRNLKDAFTDLAVWKRQKGYNVIVKCIEDIYADPRYRINEEFYDPQNNRTDTILDSAMSLRCYLKDEYHAHGHFFCLLAGDWRTPMPIRKATVEDSIIKKKWENKTWVPTDTIYVTDNCENAIPTDIYFASLTRRFKHIKRKYMTINSIKSDSLDFYYTIPVGRLLCATPREVENYLAKLILYESNPGYGDNDYLSNALFFEGCGKEWNDEEGKFLHSSCILGYSKSAREICDFFDKTIFYQDQYHLPNSPTIGEWDENADKPKTEDGPSGNEIIELLGKVGFSGWHAHGTPYGVMTSANGYVMHTSDDLIGMIPYENPDAYLRIPKSGLNNLKNLNKPSVVYSISCDNAPFDVLTWNEGEENEFRFDKPNLGQVITTESLNGACGAIMNTRLAYAGGSSCIEKEFIQSIKKHTKFGLAHRKAAFEKKNNSTWDAYTSNLIGDPEFEMWLGKPNDINISVNPLAGSVRMSGTLPDSTYYALWDGDGNMSRALVSGNQISNPYAGEYCFSLWKSGYLPVITLFGQKGTLSKAKRYVVRNVVLGNPSTDSSQSSTYSVANGGNLSVHAIDKVSTYKGFEIQSGGIAEFDCNQTVELKGGTVKKGGKLVIKAQQISMSDGFRVEEGGILQIENKSLIFRSGQKSIPKILSCPAHII